EQRNGEHPDDSLPRRKKYDDQQQPQQKIRIERLQPDGLQSDGFRLDGFHRDGRHSIPPPPLSTARMRRVCAPNASVVITSRLRGRGSLTSSMSPMRPGRAVITRTRSARNTASVVEWVTNSTVLRRSIQ